MKGHLRRAEQMDPAVHSYTTSSSRSQSLAYALAGCAYMLRHQINTRILAIATLTVIAVAIWLDIDATSWAIIGLAVALVWITEFINGAIEAAINLTSPTCHPLARIAKDVAAGAVLLASIAATGIGAVILGPHLLEKL